MLPDLLVAIFSFHIAELTQSSSPTAPSNALQKNQLRVRKGEDMVPDTSHTLKTWLCTSHHNRYVKRTVSSWKKITWKKLSRSSVSQTRCKVLDQVIQHRNLKLCWCSVLPVLRYQCCCGCGAHRRFRRFHLSGGCPTALRAADKNLVGSVCSKTCENHIFPYYASGAAALMATCAST